MNVSWVIFSLLIALEPACSLGNPVSGTWAIPAGSCGINKYNARQPYIVGGKDARAHSWPWQVAIFLNGQFSCGGSIISPDYILTAAHCVDKTKPAQFTIYAGKHALDFQEASMRTFKVASVTRHPSYNSITVQNDVALMKLSTSITFDENIQPICLPDEAIGSLEGETAIVTGWGDLHEGGYTPTVLQEVSEPILKNEICQEMMPKNTLDSGMQCAGLQNGGIGHCFGDSGGPFVLKVDSKWTQIGIVSWALGCGGKNKPDVYTRVSHFIPWVKENMV